MLSKIFNVNPVSSIATLHLSQCTKNLSLIERFYVKPEAYLYPETIFDPKSSLLEILKNVSSLIYNNSNELGKLDKEYIRLFLDIIDRIEKINIDFKSFEVLSKLLTQILKITKIPFSGEPLSGLQIMGVLESRNLDFDDVYILNMNEGEFPKSKLNISFIPFNIRKAFNLKTLDTMDKVYSYLFYRLIQRAKNITFIYNKNSDFNSKG